MKHKIKQQIQGILLVFIIILFLSGATAIPVEIELQWALRIVPADTWMYDWLQRVLTGFTAIHNEYPFLMYGYDWLAFAHFVLAILFIGPYKDPVRNIWVIQFGLIACVLIFPLALIAGYFRGIPFWWQLIDCSFGVIGFAVLWVVYKKIKILENH